jgi:hypothetical protein
LLRPHLRKGVILVASEDTFEERILTPATGRMLFSLTLQQHDIELYLNRRMSNGQEDQATRINNWLIVEALSVYGLVRGATFLLAKKCERNVQLAIGNARVLFKWVIEHLEQSPQDIERARELHDKLVELEGAVILMMARCTGISLFEG